MAGIVSCKAEGLCPSRFLFLQEVSTQVRGKSSGDLCGFSFSKECPSKFLTGVWPGGGDGGVRIMWAA